MAFSPLMFIQKHFNFSVFFHRFSQNLNERVTILYKRDHLLHYSCKSYLLLVGSAEFLTQVLTDLSPHRIPFWLWLLLLFVFTVYAEARCCIPSSLHEARGRVLRWILMYQFVHGKHHFLIQAASIGFTFREIKTPTRPQRMFTTGSEGMKKNKIQEVLVWMATMEITVWGASSSSQP